MSFSFTEDQKLLAETAERFIADRYDFETRKKIVASEEGFSREVWAEMAELGWLAVPIPEEYGGLGWGAVDTAVLMECLGRGNVVEPYVASVILGAGTITEAGSEAQKSEILPAVAEGKRLLAFAHGEPRARYTLNHVETKAEKSGDGWTLSGQKAVVIHGAQADQLIVSARTSGEARDSDGITLFLVDGSAGGLTRRDVPTNDGQRAAEVMLENVQVGADAVIGEVGGRLATIEAVVDKALIALSAEAVGAMDASVKLTRDYVSERKQFGAAIGSFQVIQHRMVEMLGAKEFCRALVYRAAGAVDADREAARSASAAKAEVGKACKFIGEESIQLHGGMGMTADMSIGHYFKRLRVIDATLGNRAHHLKRFTKLRSR